MSNLNILVRLDIVNTDIMDNDIIIVVGLHW
jgi:hypothetical protein